MLYATMAHAGYFPIDELKTLRKFGSRLQGHPHREFLPMMETSSGPLGEGLSQAVGMAIADTMDHKAGGRRIYCLMSDGELEEGQTWEAAMLGGKWRAWNWHVLEIDGHDMNAIAAAFEAAKSIYEKPTMIIAHTIPGKGVAEFEHDYRWHGKPPNAEQGMMALRELRGAAQRIGSESESPHP